MMAVNIDKYRPNCILPLQQQIMHNLLIATVPKLMYHYKIPCNEITITKTIDLTNITRKFSKADKPAS